MTGKPSALDLVSEALRLCQCGDEEVGVRLYRQALAAAGNLLVPVGLHAAMLETAGRHRAGAELRQAALRYGLDASAAIGPMKAGRFASALAEYRRCFDAGLVNAAMVDRYLVCLSRLGLSTELAGMVAHGILFRREEVGRAVIDDAAWSHLATVLRQAPREFQETTRSVRRLDRVWETHLLTDSTVVALHAAVQQRVAAYVDYVRSTGHPVSRWWPQAIGLQSWAVIASEVGGYNVPHTHGSAWVVAIAYVEGSPPAPGTDDGVLRVGPDPDGDPHCSGWPDFVVAPVPRTLVIMPGFYTHWTMPLRTATPRLSVAFNLVAA